jgi:pimeloyl-ACP methyl ester carboxylesterase
MPIRSIAGADAQYYLLSFDEHGTERPESNGILLSDVVRNKIADPKEGITDVFFTSHGWKGDVGAAIEQYDRWVGEMARSADRDVAHTARPGFKAIVVGLHWPSLPFGDESLPADQGGGLLGADDEDEIDAEVAQYAASIAETPKARDAIRTILLAERADDGANETLPANVREAYRTLYAEADLDGGDGDPGAPPGADREEFDPDAIYGVARMSAAAAEVEEESGGVLGGGFLDKVKGLVVAPLQQLSFWKMKDRARAIGESGAHALLVRLMKAARPETRFHLMGHSFGCIVVSATVAGAPGGEKLPRPVDSLFLVQGALSLWSYCPDIPVARGTAGYFNRTLKEGLVRGPIVTTRSRFDSAVGKLYPTAVTLKDQFVLADELPKFGGIGTFGAQGLGALAVDREMGAANTDYGFKNGRVYNLDANGVIKNGGGFSGAHSDIAHPEVAHVMWQAALTPP